MGSIPGESHHGRGRWRQSWLVVQLRGWRRRGRMDGVLPLPGDEHDRQDGEGNSWTQGDDRVEGGVGYGRVVS